MTDYDSCANRLHSNETKITDEMTASCEGVSSHASFRILTIVGGVNLLPL